MSEQKIRAIDTIAAEVVALKRDGRKIVQCHGCFDLLHVGHIKHLQAARRMGDVLVVTVTPDRYVNKGPGRPAFSERLRAEALAALDCVDFVAIDRCPTAVEAIGLIQPDYFVKGQEFETSAPLPPRLAAEAVAVSAAGGEVRFTYETVFSSTSLLKAHDLPRGEAAVFLDAFRKRHSVDEVLSRLAALQPLRALVIGEAIVDEYCYAVPVGKSPKEAVITTRQTRAERQAGGALACANHVAGFCDQVDLVTSTGADDADDTFIRAHLRSNVTPHFIVRPGAPTITKRRYMWDPSLVKMFEVVVMDDSPLPARLEGVLVAHLGDTLPRYDIVIVADYGHGFLGSHAATALADARFLAVNTQANASNFGFNLITKYSRLSYACIDEPEIRLAMSDRWTSVPELAERLRDRSGAAAVSVTRGAHGALTCGTDGVRWDVPVLAPAVVDRMGAGDAFLAVTSPCVASGMPLDIVAFLGSAASALAVQVVGNRTPVDPDSVGRLVKALLA